MTSHTPSSHTILHIVLRHTPSYTLSAGVAQGDIHLGFVLRGRRGTYGTGWRAWAGFGRP